jgi:cation diffusion facilitator CzcD-associated flavoprotein CzcO
VPALSKGDAAAKKVTQFARQAKWVFERPNPQLSRLFKWTMRWVPFAMRVHRAMVTFYAEWDFKSFPTESGADIRNMYTDVQGAYIRTISPTKYHDFLIPKTEVGYKCRIMDSDYLECLNRKNVELMYEDPSTGLLRTGCIPKSGRFLKADAIILANDFKIHPTLLALNLFGEGGISVVEHVSQVFQDQNAANSADKQAFLVEQI